MADVVITIPISEISYRAWLRTSYAAKALVSEEGTPLIINNELGPDQVDALEDFAEEASREVLKLFIPRQGDTAGLPFEKTDTDVIYRFNEATPVLTQAVALKSALSEDVKNALYTYITILWFSAKVNAEQLSLLQSNYNRLAVSITGNLYRLHD